MIQYLWQQVDLWSASTWLSSSWICQLCLRLKLQKMMKDVHQGRGGLFILLLLSDLNSNTLFLNTLNTEKLQILTLTSSVCTFIFFFCLKSTFLWLLDSCWRLVFWRFIDSSLQTVLNFKPAFGNNQLHFLIHVKLSGVKVQHESAAVISSWSPPFLKHELRGSQTRRGERIWMVLSYSSPSFVHWHLEEMSLSVSAIGQIDLVSKSQLRTRGDNDGGKWAGWLTSRKFPFSLIMLLLSNWDLRLPLIWGKSRPPIWFNAVCISSSVCGAARCVLFLSPSVSRSPLNPADDISEAKMPWKAEISQTFADVFHARHSTVCYISVCLRSHSVRFLKIARVTAFSCHCGLGHSWMSMRTACHITFWLMKVSLQCNFLMNVPRPL